jgi:fumarate reductase flavoprotein subunit
VGGGIAGRIAALEARECGARVVLVERSGRTPGWGNSVISGGALHAALLSPLTPSETLLARAAEVTDGATDTRLAATWARGIPDTLRWIDEHGGQLVRDGDEPHRAVVLGPVRRTVPGLSYRGMGTPRFLTELARRFAAAGGRVLQPARAHRLERAGASGWRLQVSMAERGTVLRTNAVIFADGGFQANPRLLRKYIGTAVVRLRATASSNGDALLMGQSVGADVCHMEGFYGHLLVREALNDSRFWPYPILDGLASCGIVVDRRGRRFVDEAHSGVTTTNAVARLQPGDAPCWLVFDAGAWNSVGTAGDTPPNPYLVDQGARIVRSRSIHQLAAATGMDATELREAIRAVGERPRVARPPRGRAVAITRAPYFAVSVIAGVTFTLGGLRADSNARVLDTNGRVLTGLYAAGGAMGGLHGGPRDGYLGGLLEAAVFGRIAGHHAGISSRADRRT